MLKQFDVGEMSFYHSSSRGKTKWKPIPVGRGVMMYTPKYGTRTKIEVLFADSTGKIIEQLLNELSTGSVSDGKIFVSEVIQAYDIGLKIKMN
jgi:nitrogen regulatory protein P-II 1